MKVRPIDYTELDDSDNYDSCGNPVVAVLENNGIKVLLCEECVDKLYNSIFEFKSTTFCQDCLYSIKSPYGWSYTGSCSLRKDIKCVHAMDTCEYAEKSLA